MLINKAVLIFRNLDAMLCLHLLLANVDRKTKNYVLLMNFPSDLVVRSWEAPEPQKRFRLLKMLKHVASCLAFFSLTLDDQYVFQIQKKGYFLSPETRMSVVACTASRTPEFVTCDWAERRILKTSG